MGSLMPAAAIEQRLADWRDIFDSMPLAFFTLCPPSKYSGYGKDVVMCKARYTVPVLDQLLEIHRQHGAKYLVRCIPGNLAIHGSDALTMAALIHAAAKGERLHYLTPIMTAHCTCGKCADDVGLHKCGSCRLARYCSKRCQVADWRVHKKVCTKLAAEVEGIRSHSSRLQISTPPEQRREQRVMEGTAGLYHYNLRREADGTWSSSFTQRAGVSPAERAEHERVAQHYALQRQQQQRQIQEKGRQRRLQAQQQQQQQQRQQQQQQGERRAEAARGL